MLALAVAVLLAVAGWGMWLRAARDLRDARLEAQDTHERLRLAISAASAVRAGHAAALDGQRAAEAQVKVAHVETSSLRRSLALSDADREILIRRLREVDADQTDPYDSSVQRLRLYGSSPGVRNRKDG